jgi:hypothetical protein
MIYGWPRREIAELTSAALRAHELLRERTLCARSIPNGDDRSPLFSLFLFLHLFFSFIFHDFVSFRLMQRGCARARGIGRAI